MVQLLWAKDSSLWPKELIHSNPALAKMDWVSLPDGMAQFLESVSQFLVSADADGLVDHALLTSESLNLSARAFLDLPAATRRRKVVIFDSTAPETIQNNKQQLDLRQTLFVLSNKAHYGLRDHCLFLYFREKLQALLGNRASRHFLSETEPGTYLATISRGYTFREIRPDVTAIPATYCSLMQFGGVLTATAAAPAEEIIAAVRQIQTSCSSTDSPDANPALQLAAFLTCSALGRRPYLAFLVSPSLIAYARRLAQLVGGSMAQGSAGLIPIIWPLPSPTDGLQRRTVFAVLSYKDDDDTEINKTISELQSNAEPFIHIRIEDPADLLTETFKWEAATILACARLASDPFDIDQSRVPRAFGREILEQLAHGNNPLQRSARITNSFLELYADGATRSEISTLSLTEALRSFLRIPTPGQHVSLIIDIPRTEELHEKFVVLRNLLSTTLVRPVLMAFGPYAGEYAEHFFRHSLPYGPSIIFTTDSLTDEPIPGANYTFGQLHQLMALSEYDALVHWHRPVIRLHLLQDFPAALDQMLSVFRQALQRFQPAV